MEARRGPGPARRRALIAIAALAAILMVGVRPTGAAAVAPAPASQVAAMWASYGDAGGHWTGGDGTTSVALPDGRLAWLFSDTYLGTVNSDHSRPASAPLVNNSLVVQDGTQLTQTLYGGTAAAPTALVPVTDSSGDVYWNGDGEVAGGQLRVLYNRYHRTGSGPLDVQLVGTALASFALPALTLADVHALPLGSAIAWGSALLDDGGYTYVYGTEDAGGVKFAHLARMAQGDLAGTWQFWTGSAWSASEAASARLLSGVAMSFSVERIGSQYVLVTQDTGVAFGPDFAAYTAGGPTGPFGEPGYLFVAPEASDANHYVYNPRVHPALSQPGTLLVSYNVNSFDTTENTTDVRTYRPRFVDVTWPRPVPDPAAVPSAPAGLTAATATAAVHLSWTAAAGATGYWVYRRDVTAGQTHFSRLPSAASGTSADVADLTDGHTYQFRVSGFDAAGEGAPGSTVSIVARIAAPPAPANLRVTMGGAGDASLTWDAVPTAEKYQVYRRDTTAGETDFGAVPSNQPALTSLQVAALTSGDSYDFEVRAINGGGAGPPSAIVSGTARYDVPAAPAGLTATAQGDGSVRLTWQPSPGPVWYWIYERDVTAGDTALTRLAYPVTDGTTAAPGSLVLGDVYEFQVTAFDPGGESAGSNLVRATARYDLPGAPANLRATASDAQVVLAWDAPGPGLWYWIYRRDVTAGEASFTRLELPATAATATLGLLTNGDRYEFEVTAVNAAGEGPASAVVSATPMPALPGKPTGLAATANANGSVSLTWTAPGAGLYYWVYERDVTAGQAAPTKLSLPATTASATVGSLTNGHVYEFTIAGTNAAGDGPVSDPAQVTCRFAPPPAPANLRGVTSGDGNVDLTWDATSSDVYYYVYRRDVTAGETTATKSALPATATTASVGPLVNGHTYEFTVTATNPGGESPPSNAVQVTSAGGLPRPPTNLTAQAGDGRVTLSWTASPTSGVYYWVYYRDVFQDQSFVRLSLPVNGTSLTVTPLANGHYFEFKVTATNASGDSQPAGPVTARPMPPLPPAPTGLSAIADNAAVGLGWNQTPGADLYWVYYRDTTVGQTAWTRLGLPSSAWWITVKPLANGHTYEFRVTAVNMTGEGPPSAIVQSRPVPPAPQPPTQLTAQAALGQVTLSWQASPTGSVYYWVYFRRPGQSWYYLPYPTLQTTMTVRPLLPGATYEFKVTAANLGGQSAPTNVVSVTVPLPHVVTGVRVTPGVYAATVSWNAVAGADSYQVYGYFVPLGQLNFAPSPSQMHLLKWGITGTSWTHQYLLDKGYYWYMVTAVKLGVEGPGNRSSMGWTTPYMNNDDYYYARNRFFDLPADPPDQRAVVNVGGGPDHGIVIGRGFIQPRTPLDHVIGNERGYSDDPYASSKVEVAWDTRTGEVSVYIEHSCVHPLGGLSGYCKDALPIQFVDLMPPYDDSTALCCNILEVRKTSAGVLYVAWKASNSITPSLGHIDGSFLLTPSGGGYNVNLDADRYPSYEFYRYPHYTVLGFTDSEWMGTRGQTIVQDLKLPETSQTHCASTWPWPFGRPLAC